MKHKILFLLIFLMPFSHSVSLFSQDIPEDSLYLGQTPPGSISKIFQLPLSSGCTTMEQIAISPDNKQIYYNEFNSSQHRIKYLSYANDKWNGPFVLFENYWNPVLSFSGDTMYLLDGHNHNLNNNNPNAWYSVKTDTVWSAPVKFWNHTCSKMYLQKTNKDNYYFATLIDSVGYPFISKLNISNGDTTIQSLETPLNSPDIIVAFFIARDESYIIYSHVENSFISLVISYRKNDGGWTNYKSLGTSINISDKWFPWAPYVTRDNKYLFYSNWFNTSPNPDIYWISLGNLLDSLEHTNFDPYLKTPIPNQTDTISHSYSFTIPDSTFIDDDGNNTLTYSATMPSWLDFDPITRTISGTLDTAGIFIIKVTVTDTANSSASISFSLTIVNYHPLSINQVDEYNIFIYPNPTTGLINISFGTKLVQKAIIEIYDLQGNQVFSETFHNSATAAFNIANLPKGMYIISVFDDTSTYNEIICKK